MPFILERNHIKVLASGRSFNVSRFEVGTVQAKFNGTGKIFSPNDFMGKSQSLWFKNFTFPFGISFGI